ncbi:MAG: hypothetical protein JRI43_02955 [Deltaproteobacteria bacterium]|jgi:hypothetical protein|nr:hypothetical protein [Deltaproteobacteria bacterium]
MGIVSEYLFNLIAKQVDDNGLVVWYDPDGAYAEAVLERFTFDACIIFCLSGEIISGLDQGNYRIIGVLVRNKSKKLLA